jgi:hypothetical protein
MVSRAAWGARPWSGTVHEIGLRSRTEFMTHYHGAPPAHSVGPAMAREVDDIHHANGWAGVGYNFLIDTEGTLYEGRGLDLVGAHCPDHNRIAFGVYFAVGGSQPINDAMKRTGRALYDHLCELTGRKLRKTRHGDNYPTECPGVSVTAWTHAGFPAPGGTDPHPKDPDPKDEDDMTPEQLDDLVERTAKRTAELIAGAKATYPVVVDKGTGAAHLPDGRDIDSIPRVLGELQTEFRAFAHEMRAALAANPPGASGPTR